VEKEMIDISKLRKPKNKKIAMKRALKALSDYIRERDQWTCISCGKNLYNDENRNRKIDAGHFFSRRYKAILFNEKNVNCQCVHCNQYLSGNWDEYLKAFITKYGRQYYNYLESRKNNYTKYTIDNLFETEKMFISKLNKLLDS
jgi:superfamily II helicase